jgi:hypothetical protein
MAPCEADVKLCRQAAEEETLYVDETNPEWDALAYWSGLPLLQTL